MVPKELLVDMTMIKNKGANLNGYFRNAAGVHPVIKKQSVEREFIKAFEKADAHATAMNLSKRFISWSLYVSLPFLLFIQLFTSLLNVYLIFLFNLSVCTSSIPRKLDNSEEKIRVLESLYPSLHEVLNCVVVH